MEGLCINSSIQGITPTNTIQATGVVARMTTALVRTFHRGAMITTKSGGVTTEASSISLRPIEESVESEEEFGFEVEQIERLKLNQKKENWVMKILRVGMLWREKEEEIQDEVEEKEEQIQEDDDNSSCSGCDEEFCSVVDDIEQIEFDKKSFSGLLKRVSLMEAKLYAKMSYLGILAYQVSKIKSENLLTHQDLHFVTSSLEKREQMKTKEDDTKKQTGIQQIERDETDEEAIMRKNSRMINAQTAYQIAASAASYLHSHTKTILPFRSKKTGTIEDSPSINEDVTLIKGSSKVASVLATTNSVTAVVAAKEEVKKAVAKDLNSSGSSPCDWFICDDDTIGTRFFVIQGSETLASWQANLLFEPIQFEGLDVLVHRGIYEAAKGIYEQMLPEVRSHLNRRKSSTLRFTGHSLGGSLALLINLMLLIRGEAPISSLLPVITFGAPSIMCGGDQLLRKLGLPKSHVRAISMHRDIVPRAFSCSYPNHVAEILKAVNGNFRKHPCLKNQKLLYSPMGQLLILQPDESFSPHHPLLPSGSGLYHLGHSLSRSSSRSRKRVRAAQVKFLNSPHPLEILSGPSAYGSDGTIYRDHDMNSYFLSVNCVINQETKQIRKSQRELRRKAWWPLVTPRDVGVGNVGWQTETSNVGKHLINFSGFFQSGQESLRRFSQLVASQNLQMLIVFFLPARFLLVEMFASVIFQ